MNRKKKLQTLKKKKKTYYKKHLWIKIQMMIEWWIDGIEYINKIG